MTNNDLEGVEQAFNHERELPCALVIDSSGSMSGGPLDATNAGLQLLVQEIQADSVAKQPVDLLNVTFDSEVKVVHEFGLVEEATLPKRASGGSTRLVDSVRLAAQRLKNRIDWYFASEVDCYRPYLVIITDGAQDSGQDVPGLKSELDALKNRGHNSEKRSGHPRKFHVFAYGVDGADAERLAEFSPTPPLLLSSKKFNEFFKYIATVTKQVLKSKEGEKVDISPKGLGVDDPVRVTA